MPNFNIGGETSINTVPGGFLTIMVLGMTLCYGTVKFIDLYERSDPNIRLNTVPDSYGIDDTLTFAEDLDFRVAVGAKLPGEQTLIKYDPQIIRWIALVTSKDENGEITKTYFPLHDCSEEDFVDFNPL